MIKKDQMRDMLSRRYVNFIPDLHKIHSSYRFYRNKIMNLKKLSGYIPFPCNFDKNGMCDGPMENEPMCCCYGCVAGAGYFKNMPEKDISFYAKWFSKKTGFWRKGKGCILPRERRSITCLTFYCKDVKPDHTPTPFGDELNAYRYSLRKLTDEFRYEMKKISEEMENKDVR